MAALKVFHFRVFHIPKWMEHHYSRKWNVSHGFRLWCVCACLFSVFAYSFRPLCFFQLPQDEEQETEKSRTEARPVEGRRHATGCQRSERWSAKSKSSSKSLQLVTWISPEACESNCSKQWTFSGRNAVLSARDEQSLANHCLLIARTSWISFETPAAQITCVAVLSTATLWLSSEKCWEDWHVRTALAGRILRHNSTVAIRKAES